MREAYFPATETNHTLLSVCASNFISWKTHQTNKKSSPHIFHTDSHRPINIHIYKVRDTYPHIHRDILYSKHVSDETFCTVCVEKRALTHRHPYIHT